MKKLLFRLCTVVSITALAALLISCGNMAGGTPDPKADVALAKAALKIGFTVPGDAENRVTGTLSLPGNVGNDVSVTWAAEPTDVIDVSNGSVTLKNEDQKVTVTATLEKAGVKDTKAFTLTVWGKNRIVAEAALAAIPAPESVVYGDVTENLTLVPSVSVASESVPVTWKSDKPAVITNTGAVTQPESGNKVTVTLTADVTKGGNTYTKAYKVVVYPKGETPSAEALLNTIELPATTVQNIQLSQNLGAMNITWTSSADDVIKIKFDGTALVTQDLTDRTVVLTAKIEENGKPVTRTFSITVPAITVIQERYGRKYEFVNGSLIVTSYGAKKKYTVTVDAGNKTITAKKTATYTDGKWYTMEQEKQSEIDDVQSYVKIIEALRTLAEAETITLSTIRNAFAFDAKVKELSDAKVLEHLISTYGILKPFFSGISYEQFQYIPQQEIKARIDAMRKVGAEMAGLPEDATWQQLIQKAQEMIAPEIRMIQEDYEYDTRAIVYTYTITKDIEGYYSLYIETVYNPEKPWFEQAGEYRTDSGTRVTLERRGGRRLSLVINDKWKTGEYTADGTVFTLRVSKQDNSSEEITGTITDHKNETITVSFRGNSYTLKYESLML